MINLFSLRDWTSLAEGEVLELKKKRHRSVKLHVNAADDTRLFFVTPGDEPRLLARVCGLDVIAFNHEGQIDIVSDGPILIRTADNERVHTKADGEKFTRIMERAPRNPEVEAIYRTMYTNMERRLAAQTAEMQRVFAQEARANYQERKADMQKIAELEREIEDGWEPDADGVAEGADGDAKELAEPESDAGDKPKPRARRARGRPKRGSGGAKGSASGDEKSG